MKLYLCITNDMTPKQKVLVRRPTAFLAPYPVAGAWDIIEPSNRPSPGYKAHRCLGAGTTPASAWADADKRTARRQKKGTVQL